MYARSGLPDASLEAAVNIAVFPAHQTTRAADGLERRLFTVAEAVRMYELGILEDKFELLEGEIVPMMNPANNLHERIKLALNRLLSRALPDHLQLGVETTAYLSDITFVNPDLSIFPMMKSDEVRGDHVLLAIEVAATTLKKDRGLKAAIYAKYGVRELWVIDARRMKTFVHTQPHAGGWGSNVEVPETGELRFAHADVAFVTRLADL